MASVRGTPFQRSAQVKSIRRIADRDFFTIPDRFGRFHSNLTNLKSSLRPHLRYHDSPLVNLDISNSQPMIFCLLLVNLLSGDGKLDYLMKIEFPETSNPYHIEMDEDYFSSHFPSSSDFSSSFPPFPDQILQEGDGREGDTNTLPILPVFEKKNRHCARKAQERRKRLEARKPFVGTLRVNESRPAEPGRQPEASLAWGGVTLTAKRRQRVPRPCD